MSAELPKARSLLNQVRVNIRNNKIYPAVQAYHDAVVIIVKTNLMKSERDEFERLLEQANTVMVNCKELTASCGLQISYTRGQERELLDNIKLVLVSLNATIAEDAKNSIVSKDVRKQDLLRQIEEKILEQKLEEANSLTLTLIAELGDDPIIYAEVGKLYFKYNIYKSAAEYMGSALESNPEFTELYNDIGMSLRKLKNFADAEKYYLRGAKYIPADSHLFFNLGRVYLDAQLWDKAIQAANGALKLDPEFEEAKKMLNYANSNRDKHDKQDKHDKRDA